jgi:FkbM family methyltransferase
MLKTFLQSIAKRCGYTIIPIESLSHANHRGRRTRLMKARDIDLVIDIGANIGQYATGQRKEGYSGQIVSFEPVTNAYKTLVEKAARDKFWKVHNLAVGEVDGTLEINVSHNLQSSSLLEMLPRHKKVLPESAYAHRESVEVKTLDTLLRDGYLKGDNAYLKIDAQGYEGKILDGATQTLTQKIVAVELELSLCHLYQGDVLMPEMIRRLLDMGFKMMSIDPGFTDESTGQLLQIDGVFFRE